MKAVPPALDEVRALQRKLQRWLQLTPVMRCAAIEERLGANNKIFGKMEFLQATGTFKPRGALAIVLGLDDAQRERGITAVSAGNHAIAASFAARSMNTSAKVVMTKTASPVRIAKCRHYGAEIVLADDVHHAFEVVEDIRRTEGRYFVHPFEGRDVATGTATIGLEIDDQIGAFDVAIIPIGGGGLCAGVSSAIKQVNPDCEIIGVEPSGADSMHRSFASGQAQKLNNVDTIADSLGAPFALPYSFEICRQFVNELVMVDDEQLKQTMRFLFREMKMAVEPACAAATAALLGPLRNRFTNQKIVVLFCGSNIDWHTYARHTNLGSFDANR